MANLYWSHQALDNTTQLMTLILWMLGSFVILRVPGFIGLTISSYTHSKQEDLRLYISRFIPFYAYARLVDLLHALGIATLLLIGLYRGGYISQTATWLDLGYNLGILVGACLGLRLLRSISFAVWGYTFMPYEDRGALAQDRFVLDWLGSLLYPTLSTLMLSPVPLGVSVWVSVGLLSLTLLASVIQTCRRLLHAPGSYIYLFLYLCAHELAPVAYTVALGSYVVSNKVLLNIFV